MCGIVAGVGKNGHKINKALMRRYREQKGRGTQGFGFVSVQKDGVNYVRRETEKEIEKEIMKDQSNKVMFHHRFPTSTINVEECSHPIFVSHAELDWDYYVVHNGVIGNSDELKTKHEKLGYVYNTVLSNENKTVHKSVLTGREYYTGGAKMREEYNDSEAVAIELARCIDGMSKEIDATESMALVCYQVNKETGIVNKMFFCRNDRNPLCITNNNDYIWVKSVGGKEIPPHTLFCLDMDTYEITEKAQYVGRNYPVTPPHTHTYGRDRSSSFFTENYKQYHGDKNTVSLLGDGKDGDVVKDNLIPSTYYPSTLGDDIDYGDPSEHDYKTDYKRSGKMGFNSHRKDVDFQSTLNWEEDDKQLGVGLQDDDIPYDVIFSNKTVVDLIERTLRLQRLRDQFEYAVDECDRMISDESKDATEWLSARSEAESELEKIDQRMLEIEADFYSMDNIHNGVEYYGLIEDYREGISDDDLDELLGIKNKISQVTQDGRVF